MEYLVSRGLRTASLSPWKRYQVYAGYRCAVISYLLLPDSSEDIEQYVADVLLRIHVGFQAIDAQILKGDVSCSGTKAFIH